ncbi:MULTISPECIES: ATP-grasp domain-containing protein [unclassified Streptomyces]|uniref:ATP-grasp domain-containing protein n=1 Tax=unclassified Streptomyces TaxID=2593676 RepID=UPI000DB9E03F|nr:MULTISPECIES: ATP-grasp domain-containing protein [unclassified Streptomyces]MYT75548.1 ATP-grasp domain-containing protein [Streptomyces sp. SID8367]RAJ86954.1 carbamoyl-phosphate synthase large subunit [Streptomyces sp. PsTaAH-137]
MAEPTRPGPVAGPDLAAPLGRPPRVLVTGAGGPSGVCFLRALDGAAERYAADIDPLGAGLYLVPRAYRLLLPPGDDPAFARAALALCRRYAVDVLVPTVDAELVALARAADGFADAGVRVLVPHADGLETCLDKWRLAQACEGAVRVPVTRLLGPSGASAENGFDGGFPAIAKPRTGSGSRGVTLVEDAAGLARLPQDGSYLVQEMLPGTEYSVDVLTDGTGRVVAAVPRARDKTDSGIVVAGRVLHAPELSALAEATVHTLGLRGVLNVQVREDRDGRPALLEVNPRPPGGLSLTVAAGVDMPRWAVAGLLGVDLPDRIAHRETAVVRHWQDVVMHPAELGDMGAMEGKVDARETGTGAGGPR